MIGRKDWLAVVRGESRSPQHIIVAAAVALLMAVAIAVTIDQVTDPSLTTGIFYVKLIGITMGWLTISLGLFFLVAEGMNDQQTGADASSDTDTPVQLYAAYFIGSGTCLSLVSSRFIIRNYPDWIIWEAVGYFGFAVIAISTFVHLISNRPVLEETGITDTDDQ